MRIIHISDLHAGKTLGNISRNEDLLYAMEQILYFSKENNINLILVAGDVFDKSNPDNNSKQLIFEEFFLKLNSLNIKTIVIAGNHDSYDFFKSIKEISRLANVFIFDRPDPNNFYTIEQFLCIACLPYPSERVLTEAGTRSHISYAEKVGKFLKYIEKETERFKVKILLSHIMVGGATCTYTEREVHISDYFAIPHSSLPSNFDYIALGHVHKYQRLDKAEVPTYYSGNLFQMDFSEAGQEKYFNFIEITEEGLKHIEAIKLDIKNPLYVIEIDQEDVFKRLDEIKKMNGYIKLTLKVTNKRTLPYVLDRIKEEVWDKLPKGVEIKSEFDIKKTHTLENIKISPLYLYREYYKKEYGEDLPADIEKIFIQLLEEYHEAPSS